MTWASKPRPRTFTKTRCRGCPSNPLEANQPQAHLEGGLPQGGHHLIPEGRPQVKTSHVIAARAEGDHPDAGLRPPGFPPQAVHHFQQGAVAPHRHHPVKPLPAGPGGQGFRVAGPLGPPGGHLGAGLSERRQEAGPDPARPAVARGGVNDGHGFHACPLFRVETGSRCWRGAGLRPRHCCRPPAT